MPWGYAPSAASQLFRRRDETVGKKVRQSTKRLAYGPKISLKSGHHRVLAGVFARVSLQRILIVDSESMGAREGRSIGSCQGTAADGGPLSRNAVLQQR